MIFIIRIYINKFKKVILYLALAFNIYLIYMFCLRMLISTETPQSQAAWALTAGFHDSKYTQGMRFGFPSSVSFPSYNIISLYKRGILIA
jgi:hypothetical protein